MRKLKLQMEALAVDSFSPSPSPSPRAGGRGTARAHAADTAFGPVAPPDAAQGADGPNVDLPVWGFETASCTQCNTCNC